MSDYTTKLKHKKNIFWCIDTLVWTLTPLILAILAMSHVHDASILSIFSDNVQHVLTGFGITALLSVICALVVKDKIRPFLGAISVIIAVALYSSTGMFIVFGIELFEQYVLNNLYLHYKNKYVINREIDKRNE